jgi:hypothetical protein
MEDGLVDSQIPRETSQRPILCKEGERNQDGNREEVVVKHGVPIFESGDLDSLSHKQDLLVSHPLFSISR